MACTSETSPVYLVCLVHLVSLVHLVDLVYLVSLVQPNKRDRPDRPNRPNEQDRLADFFSILLGPIDPTRTAMLITEGIVVRSRRWRRHDFLA